LHSKYSFGGVILIQVNWRTVVWGLGLQLLFAVIILRSKVGYQAFNWLGKRVAEFLAFTDDGAKFVFGDVYAEHFFAFKVRIVLFFMQCYCMTDKTVVSQ
jgi:pyrimidine nucleoside transport protein